jgi:hypothetical protein
MAAPLIIRSIRAFLVVCAVVWGFGVVEGVFSLRQQLAGREPLIPVDELSVAWRFLLFAAALFAFVAIGRRWRSGRWTALVLASVAIARTLPGVSYPWRVVLGDVSAQPPGPMMFAYSSREEAVIALLMRAGLCCWFALLIVHLAAGATVRSYFADSAVNADSLRR